MERRQAVRVLLAGVLAVATLGRPASAEEPTDRLEEVTGTERGRTMATDAAVRFQRLGVRTEARSLTVWEIGSDEYLVGTSVPVNLRTTGSTSPDGMTTVEMSYDVAVQPIVRPFKTVRRVGKMTAGWAWVGQGCFSRMGGAVLGYLDSCFVIHQLVGESDARTFFQLEQYGTLGAGSLTKIYSGFLKAGRASSSPAMSWIDWSPRGNITGPCHPVNLRVAVLGVSIAAPNVFCEHNVPTKSVAAGSFAMAWDCGCIFPFGQPYPNMREIASMQAVSIASGVARWTLSAGYAAR